MATSATPPDGLVDWTFPVTVMDVVLMGRYGKLGLVRRPGRRDHELAEQALERVHLSDRAGRQIGELSGGEQRRALIARALAQEADLLLLDEPLAGLDATAQHDLLQLLEEPCTEATLFVATRPVLRRRRLRLRRPHQPQRRRFRPPRRRFYRGEPECGLRAPSLSSRRARPSWGRERACHSERRPPFRATTSSREGIWGREWGSPLAR